MGNGQASIAAATAVIGYDLLKDTWFQQVGYPRLMTGFGLKGSAAAGDSSVDLFIDTVKIGTFFNTSTGFPNMDDLMPMGHAIPAHARLHAYVTDAPASNPLNVMIATRE